MIHTLDPYALNLHQVESQPIKGIVTAKMQQMSKMKSHKLDLETVLETPYLFERFPRGTFPEFTKTNSGIFFQPVSRVISNTGTYYVKWFSLDSDLNFSHDHNYQYAKLIPNGHLMKLEVPRLSEEINDFTISYITPVDNISVSASMEKKSEYVPQENALDNIDTVYRINYFDQEKYHSVIELMTRRDDFIKEFLSDILDN